MQCAGPAVVARIERGEQHAQFWPATLADNEALRPHPQCLADELLDIDTASTLKVWLPRLERHHVRVGDLELGDIFNSEDALPLPVGPVMSTLRRAATRLRRVSSV